MHLLAHITGRSAVFLSLLFATCFALPYQTTHDTNTAISTLFQLDRNGTWFENLAVQRNGNILATRIDAPEIWSITPRNNATQTSNSTGRLLYKIPNATSLTGITELQPDVYAVVAGNVSMPQIVPTPGSFAVWTLNLTGTRPEARVLAPVPAAHFLDGLVRFSEDLLLITDAAKGVIYRLNVTTGESSQAISHPSMVPASGQPVSVGVNGLKVQNGYVYFTSTTQEVFARVKVDKTASPIAPVEILASGFTFDDFVLTANGTAYLTTNPQNELVSVSPAGGAVRLVAGSQLHLALGGLTALAFGDDASTLYVTTCGAQFSPVLGTQMEPAKIASVKI